MEIDIISVIIIGTLLWIGVYTIIARICECFEICSMYKSVKDLRALRKSYKPVNKKVTVEDLYPKENKDENIK